MSHRKTQEQNVRECMPIYDKDGKLLSILNTKTGKMEGKSQQEQLAFDFARGKLVTKSKEMNIDNAICLGMAEDGFFFI